MNDLGVEEFRRLLSEKGLKLDERALEAAFKGARHLKSEVAQLRDYLDQVRAGKA